MILFIPFIFLFFSTNLFAGSIFSSFEEKVLSCSGLKGRFIQKVFVEGENQPQEFKGNFLIEKPDRVKIDYLSPVKQVMYIEKNRIVIYSPEEKQAVVSPIREDFILVKIFKALSDNQRLSHIFRIQDEKKVKDEYTFSLGVKDKNIKSISLTTDKDFSIKRIDILDTDNNKVKIIFENFICLEKKIDIDFKIPEDVEIIQY